MNAEANAMECEKLRKVYADGIFRRRKFEALKGISLDVRQGEIFGLLGPNGAGKTTFIKLMLGIIKKTAGDAQLLGFPAGSREARRFIGYLPENLRIPRHLNGFTALEYYGNLNDVPSSAVRARRDEVLGLVGMRERAKDSVRKYSKGMLQRIGLAQAILHRPRLLVLDEPTDGLDPRARADVRAIMKQLSDEGTTIFLNSHILQEVEMVCDRVAILDRGNLRYCGAVTDLESFVENRRGGEQPSATPTEGSDVVTAEPVRPKFEVTFTLDGAEAKLEELLTTVPVLSRDRLPSGQHVAKLGFEDQAAVDRFVDQIRAAQISLVGLNRRQISLEDAFLEILAEKADS